MCFEYRCELGRCQPHARNICLGIRHREAGSGSRHAKGREQSAIVIAHRHTYSDKIRKKLSLVGGVIALRNRGKMLFKGLSVGKGFVGERSKRQAVQNRPALVFGQQGKVELPSNGAMQGNPAADTKLYAERPIRLDAVKIGAEALIIDDKVAGLSDVINQLPQHHMPERAYGGPIKQPERDPRKPRPKDDPPRSWMPAQHPLRGEACDNAMRLRPR